MLGFVFQRLRVDVIITTEESLSGLLAALGVTTPQMELKVVTGIELEIIGQIDDYRSRL
jgi:hypothetical protein